MQCITLEIILVTLNYPVTQQVIIELMLNIYIFTNTIPQELKIYFMRVLRRKILNSIGKVLEMFFAGMHLVYIRTLNLTR